MLKSTYCLKNAPAFSRQHGAVLFIGLIFLFLMSLIAVTISRTSVLQERMTGGLRNDQLATMGAESALREAERRLWQAPLTRDFLSCGRNNLLDCYSFTPHNPIPDVKTFRDPTIKFSAVSTLLGVAYSKDLTSLPVSESTARLANRPRYIIEDLGDDVLPGMKQIALTGQPASRVGKRIYRITARSTGGSNSTERVVEGTFTTIKAR